MTGQPGTHPRALSAAWYESGPRQHESEGSGSSPSSGLRPDPGHCDLRWSPQTSSPPPLLPSGLTGLLAVDIVYPVMTATLQGQPRFSPHCLPSTPPSGLQITFGLTRLKQSPHPASPQVLGLQPQELKFVAPLSLSPTSSLGVSPGSAPPGHARVCLSPAAAVSTALTSPQQHPALLAPVLWAPHWQPERHLKNYGIIDT